MEAKVDVRKLQLLNDRIAQTIEALNQVRLSVHGLSHTPGMPPTIPFTPPTLPFQGFGPAMPSIPPYQGIFQGLQHTPFTPFSQFTPPFSQFPPQFPPFTPFTPFSLPNVPPLPFMGGLSHSSPDVFEPRAFEYKAFDPYRIVQTFPFINTPYWPTIW
jgi:hypothetical protein